MMSLETLRETLTIERLKRYLQALPSGSPVGIAEDEDNLAGGDWTHKNVIAQYLVGQLSISAITVDHFGITLIGEADALPFDASLAWVEYLLMMFDAMLAGMHTYRLVTREQALAFLAVVTAMENNREFEAEQRLHMKSERRGNEDELADNTTVKGEAPSLPYAYMVSLTTHQLLYQDVTITSEMPLSEEETIQRALEQARSEWEPGSIDESPDVDQVQTLCAGPTE